MAFHPRFTSGGGRASTGDSLAGTIPSGLASAGHLDRVRTGDSLALAIALVLATHSQWRWHRRSSSRNDRVQTRAASDADRVDTVDSRRGWPPSGWRNSRPAIRRPHVVAPLRLRSPPNWRARSGTHRRALASTLKPFMGHRGKQHERRCPNGVVAYRVVPTPYRRVSQCALPASRDADHPATATPHR